MKPPDQNERDRIREELSSSLLVEAAAGTGKTTQMVARIAALINAGQCQREQLVAVTFTRKAAAELQERLRKELPGAAECVIGTIHSFCARLLRERPVEAGVDPDFVELDEASDGRMREQAWVTFTNQLYAQDDPVLDKLDELGLTPADLKEAFAAFADYPDVAEWPAAAVKLPGLSAVVKQLRDYAAHMAKNLPAADGTDAFCVLWPRVLRMLRTHDLERAADVAEILELFQPGRSCVQKSWPGKKAQAEAEHEKWDRFCADVAEPFVAAWQAHRYAVILPLLERARAVYDQQRAAARALNFQDLLLRAAQLLRDHPAVRRYFRNRFTHILVDEFQDTDPIQAEMMLLLTASDPTERDWRKCRPVPGSLFVVGDPKQSIYRFRRADIVTYNAVKKIIGDVVTLSANFRSAAPVVNWVNATFDRLEFFPPKATAESPAYVALKVGKELADAPGVGRLSFEGGNGQDVIGEEAALIARHIRASGRSPGDFLIITRKKEQLSRYAAALQQLGLPHEVTGGTVLNEVREVALLYTLAVAALEPDNPVAVVAALRSEAFGFSDRELYKHRQSGGRFDWRSEAAGIFGEAFASLRRYAEWLGTLPACVALERVATATGLLALAAAQPEGNVAAGSLAKALELLRTLQAQLPTATEVVAQLGRWVDAEEAHDGAAATPPTGNAVRVMNLHKVKGLQGKVVFVAGPEGASDHPVRIHVDRSTTRVRGYLAFYAGDRSSRLLAAPLNWTELAAREEQFLAAEENRLLYVAATRAEQHLIISRRAKYANRNPWRALAAFVESAPELPDPGPQSALTSQPVTVSVAEVVAAQAAVQGRWELVKGATYATRAAKSVAQPVLARMDGDGARWGSVIHLLLQAAFERRDLTGLAVSALRGAELEESLADEAVATVERVMKSAIWQRAATARQRLTEVPFTVALPAGVVRGVIDLAFEEDGGWVLVDYKTDKAEVAALLEKYRQQLESYRDCWRVVGPVKEVGIFGTRTDRYGVLT
ncbi:MAG: ATP-dependent helicase/nuclease subunit A [Verrucomicrobiae bacterium]|nr:ATP-dependent helicase/nuclease subunit A [Verrucomicrobiae bacterium]